MRSRPGPTAEPAASPLLEVRDLSMRFGGLLAVDKVNFDVRRDQIFAIIGPNGAGQRPRCSTVSAASIVRPAAA